MLSAAGRQHHRLLERYARRRDPADLTALAEAFRPLALRLARRCASAPGASVRDLEPAAYEGLVRALRQFDPAGRIPFVTFAIPIMLGEIRRQPRREPPQQSIGAIRRATAAGARPTAAQLAVAVHRTEEEVVEALCASTTRAPGFDVVHGQAA